MFSWSQYVPYFNWIYSCLIHGGMPIISFHVTPWVSTFYIDYTLPWKCCWVVHIIHHSLMVLPFSLSKCSITLASSGDIFLDNYVFDTGSLRRNILYVYHFWNISYICNSPPFALSIILIISVWWPLKHMVISSMEKVTPSIQMSGNIKSIDINIGCTFHFGNFVLGRGLTNFFVMQIIHWSCCDGSFHLYQNNCRWNIFHVTCPRAVSKCFYIVVVMERINIIYKIPHSYGSPMYWMF